MSDLRCSEYNLRPLWDELLKVYEIFSSICERHQLRYCADCGTALGAVRHKGFIPWDDDFDLQMPRPDYEKLVSIISQELPDGYRWLDRFNCACYEHGFGKVIVSDKEIVERVSHESGLSLCQGIFIDIFPLDGYPDSRFERTIRRLQSRAMEIIPGVSKLLRASGLVRNPDAKRVAAQRVLTSFNERRARKYAFGSTEMCVSIGISRWFDDKPYPVKFFGMPRKVQFDRVKLPVQEDVDGYLRYLFGNYMQLPPVSRRRPGHGNGDVKPWRYGPV